MRDYCPECRETTWLHEKGICPWCDTPLTYKRGMASSQPELTYDQVQALHRAHEEGASITELARTIHEQLGYTSASMARIAIEKAFASCRFEIHNRPGPKRRAA